MTDAHTLSILMGGGKKSKTVRKASKKSARIGATVRLFNTGEVHTILSRDEKYKNAFNLSDLEFSVSRDMFVVL